MTHALDLTLAYEGLSAECERNERAASILDGGVAILANACTCSSAGSSCQTPARMWIRGFTSADREGEGSGAMGGERTVRC